jgi:hypothetical protein
VDLVKPALRFCGRTIVTIPAEPNPVITDPQAVGGLCRCLGAVLDENYRGPIAFKSRPLPAGDRPRAGLIADEWAPQWITFAITRTWQATRRLQWRVTVHYRWHREGPIDRQTGNCRRAAAPETFALIAGDRCGLDGHASPAV